MSSSFTLELDTTPPIINAKISDAVMKTIPLNVKVVANEKLYEDFCDIYIIDSRGIKTSFSLTYDELNNEYSGSLNLSSIIPGNAYIHIKVRDEVFNESADFIKNIKIITSLLKLKTSDKAIEPYTYSFSQKIKTSEKVMSIILTQQ